MSNTVGYSLGGCVTAARYNLTQGEDSTGNAVGYALPVPTCGVPIVIPEIVWSNRWAEGTFTLYGVDENPGYVSTPPKKFLRCTGSGSITYTLYWGVPPVLLVTTLGVTEIDPITGAIVSLLTVSSSNNGNPPNLVPSVRAWEGNFGSYGQSCPVFLETNTKAYRRFSHSYANPSLVPNYATRQFWDASEDDGITSWLESGAYPASSTGTLYDTLSEENTEEAAWARAALSATWSEYDSTVYEARRQARTTGFVFYEKGVEARVVTPIFGIYGTPGYLFTITISLEGRAYGSSDPWVAVAPYIVMSESDGSGRLDVPDLKIPCPAGQERRISDVVVTA